MGVHARERSGRKTAGKLRRWKRERQEEEERRMGSTSTQAALFIGGPLDLPVVVPSTIQYASTALVREIREEIVPDSSPTE
jgi:hypothetical protein